MDEFLLWIIKREFFTKFWVCRVITKNVSELYTSVHQSVNGAVTIATINFLYNQFPQTLYLHVRSMLIVPHLQTIQQIYFVMFFFYFIFFFSNCLLINLEVLLYVLKNICTLINNAKKKINIMRSRTFYFHIN